MRIGWFGPAAAAAFLLGATCLQAFTDLPGLPGLTVACGMGLALAWLRQARPLGLFLLGWAWAALHAQAALGDRLPAALDGQEWAISGRILDLPVTRPGHQRFDLYVERGNVLLRYKKLRLTLYADQPELRAGDRLRLLVRLQAPRGTANPAGFDATRYALLRRLAAVGYVRQLQSREPAAGPGISGVRTQVAAWIDSHAGSKRAASLLRALAIGDQAAISARDWRIFQNTGTAHLIAISGFHVGMVGACGAFGVWLLGWLFPGWMMRVNRRQVQAVAAFACALAYGLVAGWSLPVQRTVWMILWVCLCLCSRRHLSAWNGLSFALLTLLLMDPLAVLDNGFWLSFLGVAWLVYALSAAAPTPWWRGFWRAQWVSSLGLAPIGAFLFQQVPLAGVAVNLLAVPALSLCVIPLLLSAVALRFIHEALGAALLRGCALLARWFLDALSGLSQLPWANLYISSPPWAVLVLASTGVAVYLLPRGVAGRRLGLLLCLPLLFPQRDAPEHGAFDIIALDVGQGLAVAIRTRRHALLFDTGAAWGDDFNYGDAAVVPGLRAMHVHQLDALVISHNDGDHAGGAAAIIGALAPKRVFTGPDVPFGEACLAGKSWRWDGVRFTFLHPPAFFPRLGNENSCVLQVRSGHSSVLITGDASTLIEARLLREQGDSLRADLLVLGHHGSHTASSAGFLDGVRPRYALVSAGYRNRFGHPAPEVVARLRARGIVMLETSASGQIWLRWDARGHITRARHWRVAARRYWHAHDFP